VIVSKWPVLVQFDSSAIQTLDKFSSRELTRSEHIRLALDEYLNKLVNE